MTCIIIIIIIIKSEVSTFPIVVICFRGCVSEMVVLSYSVIYYIYIPGPLGPCFHYWCSVYGICKWSDILVVFVCLRITPSHYHHYADFSDGIWTTKMLSQVYAAEYVSKIKTILSIIFCSIYGAVCLQFTQFSCDDRENVYFILLSSSNRKYETLTIV